tara:strand:+ start:2541 stop:2798 length:258 start_codon:yes stop_codon:yes gene_type:complete
MDSGKYLKVSLNACFSRQLEGKDLEEEEEEEEEEEVKKNDQHVCKFDIAGSLSIGANGISTGGCRSSSRCGAKIRSSRCARISIL